MSGSMGSGKIPLFVMDADLSAVTGIAAAGAMEWFRQLFSEVYAGNVISG